MPSTDKSLFQDQYAFEKSKNLPNLKSPDIQTAKNYHLLRKEATERINKIDLFTAIPVDILDFENSILELAESMENTPSIRDLYKLRKLTTGDSKNAGISTDEATRLKNCMMQGRELYLAGTRGSLMVKPLNFFYALTAYTYVIIVLNNPIRYNKGNIPGSHGMSYLPDTIEAQFGGDSARGTFSDLFTAFPTHLVKTNAIEFSIDCTNSIIEFYKTRFSVGLGTLLSMVPEMSDYYKLTTGRNSRCHPLDIRSANDPRQLTWEFLIGDGEKKPDMKGIEDSFRDFSHTERHGQIVITVPASKAPDIKACIYTDIRGKLWYVENPFFPIIPPEIAIHFLVTSIFSNIMRYRPDEWGSVLFNNVSPNISLITRHYFSSFERKFFLVVLRAISKYIPYAI